MEDTEQNEKYDFYAMGVRCGKDLSSDLKATANKIEREFGKKEKMMFEAGAISVISQYEKYEEIEDTGLDDLQGKDLIAIDGTEYGLMNNSYLGKDGTSTRIRGTKIEAILEEEYNQIIQEAKQELDSSKPIRM